MPRYVILQDPGHNRVYFNASGQMALAELSLLCEYRHWSPPTETHIAGIRYLQFDTDSALTPADRRALAQLSSSYALFATVDAGNQLHLLPEPAQSDAMIDDKISVLQKYPGKTNEHFTRLMINMARYALPDPDKDQLKLLDPVAGRGTTLFEALALGMSATGIELESRSVDEMRIFFKKFLEQERIKHLYERKRVAGKSKSDAVFSEQFVFGADKQSLKNASHSLNLIHGDTVETASYCKAGSFDLVVGDLPYGIGHSNKTQQQKSRNPLELVRDAAPGWRKALRTGGVLALAWNAHLIKRHALAEPLEQAGFAVLHQTPYDQLVHRVDSAIKRDLIVAKAQENPPG